MPKGCLAQEDQVLGRGARIRPGLVGIHLPPLWEHRYITSLPPSSSPAKSVETLIPQDFKMRKKVVAVYAPEHVEEEELHTPPTLPSPIHMWYADSKMISRSLQES